MSRLRTGVVLALLLAAPWAGGSVRAADPPGAANAQVGATAEALFEEGRTLMKAKKYGEACAKLSASHRIDPALGTMLYLADCYEKNGQLASAWSMFTDAQAAAQQANQNDRALKAKLRIQNLVPKLVKLNITLAPENGPLKDVELKRDGIPVGAALLGTSVPVDPGDHTIEVSAAGKKPWSGTVSVPTKAGSVVAFVVPRLEDLPPPPPVEPDPPPTATATATAPPPPTVTAVVPTATAPPLPPPPDTTIRTVGFFVGGVGLAGVIVASALGLSAKSKNDQALDGHCDATTCKDMEGIALNNDAKSFAMGSTIAFIAGGAVLATGLGMIIYPSLAGTSERKATTAKPSADVVIGPGSLSVRGRF
jgi:hypothetical protein